MKKYFFIILLLSSLPAFAEDKGGAYNAGKVFAYIAIGAGIFALFARFMRKRAERERDRENNS